MGRMPILAGVALIALGIVVTLGERLPVRLGRLPGDIVLRGKNSVFYLPLATCLLVSLLATAVVWLLCRR